MAQVSVKSIEESINKIDGLEDEALDKLIETFTLEQEELVNYILQAGIEYNNEELNVYAIYYFAVIYQAFISDQQHPKVVTEQMIDDFQEPFHLALDAIYKDEDFVPLHELICQTHLMQFLTNEIEAEDDEGESLDETTQSQLFIVISSLIGLLGSAVGK